jgi:hypothetical protein
MSNWSRLSLAEAALLLRVDEASLEHCRDFTIDEREGDLHFMALRSVALKLSRKQFEQYAL